MLNVTKIIQWCGSGALLLIGVFAARSALAYNGCPNEPIGDTCLRNDTIKHWSDGTFEVPQYGSMVTPENNGTLVFEEYQQAFPFGGTVTYQCVMGFAWEGNQNSAVTFANGVGSSGSVSVPFFSPSTTVAAESLYCYH